MSWLDAVKTNLIITTGDGTIFGQPTQRDTDGQPIIVMWINARKLVEYNTAAFEFPSVVGTLVYRGTPKGTRYQLDIFFQGSDHLNTAQRFQNAAADPRPWVIQHPYYGKLKVQPIALEFDNSALNITKISGQVIETIEANYPTGANNPTDKISSDTLTALSITSLAAANNETITKVPPVNQQIKAKGNLLSQFQQYLTAVQNAVQQTTTDFQNFYNDYQSAINSLDSLITAPSTVLPLLQQLILAPAQFTLPVANKFNLLTNQFAAFETAIQSAPGVVISNLDKLMYEITGGACIAALCYAAGNPLPTDYTNSLATLDILGQILQFYNQYLTDLDGLQTTTGGQINSYFPDADSLSFLTELVNYTIGNLYVIAQNGQQQRSIVLDVDSDWINLTYRLYGLDPGDNNLQLLMQQNNVGSNSLLIVKKNNRVVYYI